MVCWSAISHTSHSPYISLGPVRTLFGWIDQWIGNVARWQTSTASPVARSWVMYFVLLGHYITFITFIRKYHTFPSEFSQKMKMMKDILNLLESFAIGSNLSPEPNWADFHRFPMSCRCHAGFPNFPNTELRGFAMLRWGFNLHVHMHNSELAQLIPVATLEFIASTEAGRVKDEEMIGSDGKWLEAMAQCGTIFGESWRYSTS